MFKSVLCQQSWWRGVLVKTRKMGSSYQPLLSKTQNTDTSSATTPSRSRSLPTSLVQASIIKKEHFNTTPTVDEVDDATPFLRTV
jgi:hypothetical protein